MLAWYMLWPCVSVCVPICLSQIKSSVEMAKHFIMRLKIVQHDSPHTVHFGSKNGSVLYFQMTSTNNGHY